MQNIFFHSEDTSFILKNKKLIRSWIESSCKQEGYSIANINIIICSDSYLLKMNKEHLNHNYFTDIITFQYSENQELEGDLFISIDTIKSNSKKNKTTLNDELHRVIIHGCLHLMGYNDKTDAQKKEMRQKEDYYLSLRPEKCST